MGFVANALAATVVILTSMMATGLWRLFSEDDAAVAFATQRDFGVQDPWPQFVGRFLSVMACKKARNTFLPPSRLVLDEMLMSQRLQVLYPLAKLSIPDLLASQPLSTLQLSRSLALPRPDKLFRLLSAAQALGYLRFDRQGFWRLTRQGVVLQAAHPSSIRPVVLFMAEDMQRVWGHLLEDLQPPPAAPAAGAPGLFPRLHNGTDFWQYAAADPAKQQLFAEAMSATDAVEWFGPVFDFDWSTFKRVIDVGGSEGSFLYRLLQVHPALQGVVFDLPRVVEASSRPAWEQQEEALRNRTELAAGDFFRPETLPALRDGDALVLREVLHDWTDEQVAAILRSLREAIGAADVRLLVVEQLPERKDLLFSRFLLDLHMMLMFDGKERSPEEFGALLRGAGFRPLGVTETRAVVRVLEAAPVVEGGSAAV